MSTPTKRTDFLVKSSEGRVMTPATACHQLRAKARTNKIFLSASEQSLLKEFDRKPMDKITREGAEIYAQLLMKAVSAHGCQLTNKPKPRATVVKKPTPSRPVSAARVAQVRVERARHPFAAAAERLKQKYVKPHLLDKVAAAIRRCS